MITRIKFDPELLQLLGLKTPELHGLGPLVVLAGPNGGGKSRHLQLVHLAIERYRGARIEVDPLRDARLKDPHLVERVYRDSLRVLQDTELVPYEPRPNTVPLSYEPATPAANPGELAPRTFDRHVADIDSGSYNAIATGLHVYLESTARALWHGTHPGSGGHPGVVEEFDRARRLNEILRVLLGTTVEPEFTNNSRIVPRLFGSEFWPNRLSAGQRVLICWAILLSRQGRHYKDVIVLLDEPEVYLHPDACVRAIGSLQKLIGERGQIWIATHSLPLIAWAGTDSLYFVQDGIATFAGAHPSRVWRTLLGDDTTRDALLTFLDGDAAAAATRFASECLLLPGVAPAHSEDPQSKQLAPIVAKRLRTGAPVRVLELGAGRGRLAAAVADLLRGEPGAPAVPAAPSDPEVLTEADTSAPSGTPPNAPGVAAKSEAPSQPDVPVEPDATPPSRLSPAHLTYIAYEDPRFVVPAHRASCEGHLAELRVLGATARYSTNLAELQARDSDHVDLAVLANTLHEIPIEDWLELFEQIRRASNPDATLLVIEDQEPRIGELPHPRGFLILDRQEWRALVDHDVPERVCEHNGRMLTAFEIPVARLAVAKANLGRTLQLVINRAIAEIRKLRNEPTDSHRAGRRHAFFAMLHLNATLAQKTYPI